MISKLGYYWVMTSKLVEVRGPTTELRAAGTYFNMVRTVVLWWA